ncbi:MAG: hypothetical protein ACEQR5_04865 [Moraxellaceae bacterium]
MKVLVSSLLVLMLFAQCMKGQHVDLIVHNATIHTMNDYNDVEEAMPFVMVKLLKLDRNDRSITSTAQMNI